MQLLRRIPHWVRTSSASEYHHALVQLAKSSTGSFDKPREMNYVLFGLRPGSELEELTHELTTAGWRCTTQVQAGTEGQLVLTATKQGYRLTQDRYLHDQTYFRKCADRYGIKYDGWFASH